MWGVWLFAVVVHGQPVPSAGQEVSPPLALPRGEGIELVRMRCVLCHDERLIVQQQLTLEGWQRELDKMIGWGASVEGSERSVLLNYLVRQFGAPSNVSVPTTDAGARLLETRCILCHDGQLIEQQSLTVAGWSREVDKMVGWGASLTDQDKKVLVTYLSQVFPAARRAVP